MLLDLDMKTEEVEKLVKAREEEIKKERKKSQSGVSSELVEFNYSQKNIKELVSEFAQKLGINILYPETDPLAVQVTFNVGRKLTVAEAWEFVKMILEQAGYTLILRVPGVYTVMQNKSAAKEAIPLYINVDYNQLPDGMDRIRYMYTFANINIGKQFQADLNPILMNILGSAETFIPDNNSNAIIFTHRSDLIKSAMQILTVFDESGITQTTEIMKLDHAQAADVVTLFTSVMVGDSSKKGAGFLSTNTIQRARYFSESLKVLNLDAQNARNLNSIVIIGKQEDVDQVKNFVKKYLDIPQEKGKSFFHVVELEWIQAEDFAKNLNNLISAGSGGGAQSTSTIISDIGFDPYIQIMAEKTRQGSNVGTSQSTQSQSNAAPNTGQRGGNKLIIACSDRDWQRIDQLIKAIDKPQKQVIIEGLVMDLDSTFVRNLGAQIRTQGITTSVFPKNMQAQAALLAPAVLGNAPGSGTYASSYYDLVGDLSDLLNPTGIGGSGTDLTNPNGTPLTAATSTSFTPGSVLGLISGGKSKTNGAWAFFQLLSSHSGSKIFTRPVLMALNNQTVTVNSTVTKNLQSSVSGTVNPVLSYVQQDATVNMSFTPIISYNNTVNMTINLTLNNWEDLTDPANGTYAKRSVTTNVSLKNGDVLVLGGLITNTSIVSKRSVPLFEKIPIIGNFFASRRKSTDKKQLFIVIRTTVVEPRTHAGMGQMTKYAADYMVDQLAETEEVFGSLKDPITRWFFNSNRAESPSEYLEDSIDHLSKEDYGLESLRTELAHPKSWHEKISEKGANIRVGWFSDVKSKDHEASAPATTEDMQKLQSLLKNIQNPFESRLVV
jgi:general secretion pathway protein D